MNIKFTTASCSRDIINEPIIDHKSGDQYIMNFYNAGGVKFGISVR